jgi:hypothetical protein
MRSLQTIAGEYKRRISTIWMKQDSSGECSLLETFDPNLGPV